MITGTEGEIVVPSFPLPHQDDRLILRRGRHEVVEHPGTRSSYTYPLEAFDAAVRRGSPVRTDATFSVAVMELVDATYAAAGLPLRPTSTP